MISRKRAWTDSSKHRGQRGFSLVELMVAMVLSLFLVGGVILMYTSGKAAIDDGQRLARLQENMRFAVEFMVRDIRQTGYLRETNFAIVTADQLEIFYDAEPPPGADDPTPRDCTGAEPTSGTIVRNVYTLSGGALRCNSQALVDGVSSLQFAEIRDSEDNLIGVEVTLGFDPGGEFAARQMSFVVAFRNRVLAPMWG